MAGTGASVTSVTPMWWNSRPGVFFGFLLVLMNATTASTQPVPAVPALAATAMGVSGWHPVDAAERADAVRRARALGLLDPPDAG